MKVLFASAEVAPFSKVGGLADVVGSLPKELVKKGVEIAIFTPLYGCIDQTKFNIKEIPNSRYRIRFGHAEFDFELKTCKLPNTDINVFFIDNYKYFGLFNAVYPTCTDTRYEHEKYVAFSMATLEYAKQINFKPDIIHANDWHTAMIPAFLKSNYNMDDFYKNTKTVFSIHNLAYQGTFFDEILDFANMQKHLVYHENGLEHYGMVNWMKGAINFSDKIIAVSPRYAEEIMTGEYGEGMDYTLRGAWGKVKGILNGIDYSVFDPKTDKKLSRNYDFKTIKDKQISKKEICEYFSLEYNPNKPVIVLISRLVKQKGLDLIRAIENELPKLDAQFIFLGTGEKQYENLFIWMSNNFPNVRALIDYKADLAQKLYAGADMFLMPSAFEPCGLSQLIAMKYGTIPLVRATGGLENSITGYPLDKANGFKFWRYDGYDMLSCINCAINVYKDSKTWNVLIKNAMEADFSWEKSAEEYLNLYNSLL